jgi:hypothetical protein
MACNIYDLTLRQIKEIQALTMPQSENLRRKDHGINIVVLDRGFVYVGKVSTDANWCYIAEAQNVRVWGTSKGLGELANNGPTTGTKLDNCGEVQAPLRAVIHLMKVEESKWLRKS